MINQRTKSLFIVMSLEVTFGESFVFCFMLRGRFFCLSQKGANVTRTEPFNHNNEKYNFLHFINMAVYYDEKSKFNII